MPSAVIDVEESSLDQRAVVSQVSPGYEDEKADFTDEQLSSEDKSADAWQPQDA